MLHHAGESLKHAQGFYCSAKHKQGNTDGNRLEKQFAAVSAEEWCCGDRARHGEVPRRTAGLREWSVDRGQKLLNLKWAEMLLDKASIRHLLYHLDKSCFRVTLRLVKPVAQLPDPRRCGLCEKVVQK